MLVNLNYNKNGKRWMAAAFAFALSAVCLAQGRKEMNLASWEFSRDGKAWSQVAVPHDWAISGPFDKKWDLQVVAIEQNGEKEKTEKSGRSGSLPWIGEGQYRIWFCQKDISVQYLCLMVR